MKILIFGAGAIGMAFGGFLSRDHDVTLLGRRPHMEAIRRRGLGVSGIWGRHVFRRFRLFHDFLDLKRTGARFDLILVCVKSYDTRKAAGMIREIMAPETLVILLQNGLGNIETMHRMISPHKVLAARVIFGVEILGKGQIKITVIAHPTAVGETVRHVRTPRVKRIAAIFEKAGLPSIPAKDVQSLLWGKVIYNAALNPLASILECHYGYLAERDLTRGLMDEVIGEIYRVAQKAKIRLRPRSATGYKKLFYEKLVPSTYHHHPSMLQDILGGKPTEINAMNGAVIRIARRAGVRVPVNRFLVRAIKAKEAG